MSLSVCFMHNCVCLGPAYTTTTTVKMTTATMSTTISTASIHVNGDPSVGSGDPTVGSGELELVGAILGSTVGSGTASMVTTFKHREREIEDT